MPTAVEVKAEILARSNPRKCKNVEAVWQVLEAMRAKGVVVLTINTVGRACEEEGVFKEQSIRNASGADYRALILAYAANIGAATAHVPRKAQSSLEATIHNIKDLDVRTRLNALIAENGNQRAEINRLKEAFKSFRPLETKAPSSPIPSYHNPEIIPPNPQRFDLVPLQKFISDEFLDDNRWCVDQHGAIRDANGDRLTPVGFVPALSAILRASTKEPSHAVTDGSMNQL